MQRHHSTSIRVFVTRQWFVSVTTLAFIAGLGCKKEPRRLEARAEPSPAAMPHPVAVPAVRPDAARAATPPPSERGGHDVRQSSARKCAEICRRSEPLRCRNARECKPRCESMASTPICRAEMSGLFDCLLTQPAKNWECDEEGIGAIRDPFCSKEQASLAICLETKLGR